MKILNTLAATAVATCIAGSALAGGFGAVIEEVDIVVPDNSGSLPGWVIPALIVAALIGVASSGGDDDSDTASGGGGSADLAR